MPCCYCFVVPYERTRANHTAGRWRQHTRDEGCTAGLHDVFSKLKTLLVPQRSLGFIRAAMTPGTPKPMPIIPLTTSCRSPTLATSSVFCA